MPQLRDLAIQPQECVLVSACLLGVECRYDGKSKPQRRALELLYGAACVPVCPEQLGGLPTPRPRSHLVEGDGRAVLVGKATVVADDGRDVTDAFRKGARECLRLAQLFGAKRAVLKQRSPSCGFGVVKVDGRRTDGVGVAAAALEADGIEIVAMD